MPNDAPVQEITTAMSPAEMPTDPASDSPLKKINIVVTGDIFFERYVWRQRSKPTQDRAMPYTWPDELRESEATSTYSELCGAPLHKKIYDEFLKACNPPPASRLNYDIQVVPDERTIRKEVTTFRVKNRRQQYEDVDTGPFPLYVHELDAFQEKGREGEFRPQVSSKMVWRICNTFGELRRKDNQGNRKLIDEAMLSLGQSVAAWLNALVAPSGKRGETIVIVNDRNALKDGMESTNIRTVFSQIIAKSPELQSLDEQEDLLILWHTRVPLHDNALERFLSQPALVRRTIPIINFNCLRDSGVPIRFDMSYESAIQMLLKSRDHASIKALLKFPQVLIRFDYGIMHLTTDARGAVSGLDIHGFSEGPYQFASIRGIVPHTTPLLIGSILREVGLAGGVERFLKLAGEVKHPTVTHNTPLDRAIDVGLMVSGMHFQRGFGEHAPPKVPELFRDREQGDAASPSGGRRHSTGPSYGDLVKEFFGMSEDAGEPDSWPMEYTLRMKKEASKVDDLPQLTRMSIDPQDIYHTPTDGNTIIVRDPLPHVSRLDAVFDTDLILRHSMAQDSSMIADGRIANTASKPDKDDILHRIVEQGLDRVLTRSQENGQRVEPSVLCPFVRWKEHISVDYHDIDTYIAVRNLVESYVGRDAWTPPLAIAVFGKPGSGKNTIVSSILDSIDECVYDKTLSCNMSQWSHIRHLTRQFHKIQDRTIRGRGSDRSIPIVLFDEFDSPYNNQPVGWLKFFLMPLQDGLYIDDNDTFHFGKSIFVFAGGVAESREDFVAKFKGGSDQKVGDFLSRLRGHIDVQDVSPKPAAAAASIKEIEFEKLSAQIRRAVVLRALLWKFARQVFDPSSRIATVHKAIVAAFLNVKEFQHGVRSMEAIVQMSRVPSKESSFQPSALPPRQQLNMHVEADEFLGIIDRYRIE